MSRFCGRVKCSKVEQDWISWGPLVTILQVNISKCISGDRGVDLRSYQKLCVKPNNIQFINITWYNFEILCNNLIFWNAKFVQSWFSEMHDLLKKKFEIPVAILAFESISLYSNYISRGKWKKTQIWFEESLLSISKNYY